MSDGLFANVSSGYRIGARSLWVWLGDTHWLFKPFGIIWVLPTSAILWGIGLALYVLVVFDVLAAWVDGIRNWLLGVLERTAEAMVERRWSYFVAPLTIIPTLPLIVAAGLLPKLGIATLIPHGHDHDGPDIHPDGGYFRSAARLFRHLAQASWRGLWGHGLLFVPFALPIAAITLPLTLGGAVLFTALTALDLISFLVNWLRRGVTTIIDSLAWGARNSMVSAVINPALMILLLPVFVAVLLIPKLSTAHHQA